MIHLDDFKLLTELSNRCLAFTPGITKSTMLDVGIFMMVWVNVNDVKMFWN